MTPAGGSVSATLGTQTVTVRAPAGAVSGSGTLTLTVYGSGAAPRSLHSTARTVKTIGASGVLLIEFSVALTGTTLVAPLQSTLTTPAAVAGSIFRLAGYATSFDDVDTVTWAAGTATSDQNTLFSRMSLADPAGTVYAFYTEPSTEATGPTIVVTPATTATLPIGMFGSATYSATEAESNGFPYLDKTLVYSLDNISLGTINGSTGAFTAGGVDGTGNVVATDTTAGRGNPRGTARVTVSSQRPGNAGDAFSFTGSFSSTTQLAPVSTNPSPHPQTDTATIAMTSTVSGFAPVSAGGVSVVRSVETDTYPLLTLKTTTDSRYTYAPSPGHASLLINSTDATDSNGVRYQTTYNAGNGLLDILPETAGSFGPNNAALRYVETDQAGFSRDRTVAANGSFTELGKDVFNDVQTATVNGDLSASLDARQYSGYRFTMSAPSGTPQRIIFRAFNGAGTQLAAFNLPSWVPATLTQPSVETDVTTTGVAYPGACSVPAKYGTSGNQIVQTITRADTAFGNLETFTTTTYMSPRVGPVCIRMADSVQTFYDFTLQNGFVVLVSGGTAWLQNTTISQTLTLQSATVEGGTATLSAARNTSAMPSNALAPVTSIRARFEHTVREKLGGMRKATFNRNFASQGVQQL